MLSLLRGRERTHFLLIAASKYDAVSLIRDVCSGEAHAIHFAIQNRPSVLVACCRSSLGMITSTLAWAIRNTRFGKLRLGAQLPPVLVVKYDREIEVQESSCIKLLSS